jgi:acid-sensing ion channel, other
MLNFLFSIADDFNFLQHGRKAPHWSLEEGYKTSNISTYPNRAMGPGKSGELQILMSSDLGDYDARCQGRNQGFKVVLHTPGEIPFVSKKSFRIAQDQDVLVSVKPNIMITSEELQSF